VCVRAPRWWWCICHHHLGAVSRMWQAFWSSRRA
jgi:hypothetical protein